MTAYSKYKCRCELCRDRKRQEVREYDEKYPERRKEARFKSRLKIMYGISYEEWEELYEIQNQACAICRRPLPARELTVDHNHDTGKARGLLCFSCNTGLGQFRDNEELLSRAISYLRARNLEQVSNDPERSSKRQLQSNTSCSF